MKKLLFTLAFILFTCSLFGQLSENFQSWTSQTSYLTTQSSQSGNGGTWLYTKTIVAPGGAANGTGSAGYSQLSKAGGELITPVISSGGVGTLTLKLRVSGSNGGFALYKRANGGAWELINAYSTSSTTAFTSDITINDSRANLELRVYNNNANRALYIHDYITTVGPPPASNSDCGTITALAVPATENGTETTGTQTTCGRSNDYPAGSFGNSLYGDGEDAIWSFTLTSSGNYKFDIAGAATYKILSMHSSCVPSTGNLINHAVTGSGTTGTFNQNLSAGTYYLWVDTWPSPACGEYSITVTKLAPPPPNDDPSGAIELIINDPLGYKTFTNEGMTLTTGVPAPGCASLTESDVWFKVVVPQYLSILDFDTQTGVITDGGMAIYRGTPGSLTLIECDDDDGLDGLMPWIYREDFIQYETIYIRFWEYGGGTTGTFKIYVSTPQALPVELTQFEAVGYPQWNIVKWTTASEHNSSHFVLHSSYDGENWREIATKDAAGNSTEEVRYSFIDYNQKELTYYRLVQVDIDGKYDVYGPISVMKSSRDKEIVKYVNSLGQEVSPDTKGLIIIVYDDGSSEKTIK